MSSISTSASSRKKIALLCSPGMGVLDIWLPIISRLKAQHPNIKFQCIVPKAATIEQLNTTGILEQEAARIFSSYLVQSIFGNWFITNTLSETQTAHKPKTWQRLLLRLKNHAGKYPVIKGLMPQLWQLLQRTEAVMCKNHICNMPDILSKTNAMLFDLHESVKDYAEDIFAAVRPCPKFSLLHGVNINLEQASTNPLPQKKLEHTKAYVFSALERAHYEKRFGITGDDVVLRGVPKYDPDWIEKLTRATTADHPWHNFVFIVSRPTLPYLPYERKQAALQQIKHIIIDKHQLKVVVKHHPKEQSDGLYERVFGSANYNKTWCYTSNHPLTIAKKAKFAISFFSGVAVDMIVSDCPVLEYLDLRGLKAFDHEKALRDKQGHPVFNYRYLQLVLGVSDGDGLDKACQEVINQPQAVLLRQQQRYQQLFLAEPDSADKICLDIENTLKLTTTHGATHTPSVPQAAVDA